MNDAAALGERVMLATIGMFDLASIHLGDRLGLYASLRDHGPADAGELATRTGLDQRYLREWLEQQATTGILTTTGDGRFELPAGHAEALVDRDSPAYIAPLARQGVGILRPMDQLIEAFATGEGVPYAAYGDDTREGIGALNRAMFVNDLAGWLGSIASVDVRLRAPGARVADLGCGEGWSTIAIANAYPTAHVDGYDLDPASIRAAERHASEAGVADRVTFACHDVTTGVSAPAYDLATIFEALHDMADPVRALAAVRRILTPDGSLVVADERVADEFAPPGDELERLMHGFSVLHCLPASRDDSDSAAVGTMLRAPLLRSMAEQAGFDTVDVLPIENDFWRFYHLLVAGGSSTQPA